MLHIIIAISTFIINISLCSYLIYESVRRFRRKTNLHTIEATFHIGLAWFFFGFSICFFIGFGVIAEIIEQQNGGWTILGSIMSVPMALLSFFLAFHKVIIDEKTHVIKYYSYARIITSTVYELTSHSTVFEVYKVYKGKRIAFSIFTRNMEETKSIVLYLRRNTDLYNKE